MLTIIDSYLAGQDRFEAITKQYLRGVHCAVIVYDITDRSSFDAIQKYINFFEENQVNIMNFLYLSCNNN